MDNKEEIIQKSKHNILTTILGFYDMKSSDEVSSRDYNYFTKREIAKFKRINPDEIRIISFYHYMIDLDAGPCIVKRVSGCGVGTEYLAVTPNGELYPCHQFVGDESF